MLPKILINFSAHLVMIYESLNYYLIINNYILLYYFPTGSKFTYNHKLDKLFLENVILRDRVICLYRCTT